MRYPVLSNRGEAHLALYIGDCDVQRRVGAAEQRRRGLGRHSRSILKEIYKVSSGIVDLTMSFLTFAQLRVIDAVVSEDSLQRFTQGDRQRRIRPHR